MIGPGGHVLKRDSSPVALRGPMIRPPTPKMNKKKNSTRISDNEPSRIQVRDFPLVL